MARVRLTAGAEIDTLTAAELQSALADQIDRLVNLGRKPESFDRTASATTSSAGALAFTRIYTVPVGMVAVIHRINIEAAGYTRAAPVTAGWLAFCLDEGSQSKTFVGTPIGSTAVAPGTIVDSISAGKTAKGGQAIGVYGAGLPASVLFTFNMQIQLRETER